MLSRKQPSWNSSYYSTYSRSNVYNDENGDLVFTLEIPGLGKEDISVRVVPEDHILEIETPEKNIKRTVSDTYSLTDAKVTLDKGILEIVFPLREKETFELMIH